MQATLSTRKATIADIPFLARIEYEASLPPLNQCFWEGILQGTKGLPSSVFVLSDILPAPPIRDGVGFSLHRHPIG